MKIAEVWDYTSNVESFYLDGEVAKKFKTNKPYMHNHSISPNCFLHGPIYPWVFGDGSYFINLEEYGGVAPYDSDVDMVLYANERVGLMTEYYQKYSVDSIRKQFPNAVIIGYVKEIGVNFNSGPIELGPNEAPRRAVRPERPKNRIRLFDDCDFVLMPSISDGFCSKVDYITKLQSDINKKITFIPGPTNTNYIFDNYYSEEKLNSIFAYAPSQHHRRGDTLKFAQYIGKKYNLPVHHKPLYNDRPFDYLSSHDFVSLWSPHLYHFNLDNTKTQPGQQCKLVASAGSINIGGVNDSHQFLYPETATCNLSKLEDVFVKYHEDENARFEAVRYAWERVNELSGFDNVKRLFKEEFLS
tara:strand:- start:1304 stop:2374 length:1071 start_codon:yes stop_codon:yes gene_type:complete